MNQEGVYGYDESSSDLCSFMQNLTLSNNNYNGESVLPSQCQLRYGASNYVAPSYANNYQVSPSFAQSVIGNNKGLDYYPLFPSGCSSSGSSGISYRSSNTQAPALYPSTTDLIRDIFVESRPQDRLELTLEDVLLNPYTIMIDPGRHHDFMKLLDDKLCTKNVITGILKRIAKFPDKLVLASCHSLGSQVLQKLIRVANKVPLVVLIPRIFAPNIIYLLKHQYGRHVVQKCFVHLDKLKNKLLYEELVKHWWPISTDKYGCIAIQECINYIDSSTQLSYAYNGEMVYASSESSPKDRLLKEISNNAALLALDLHGNFVLQYVILLNYPSCKEVIAEGLKPVYEILCTNRSGSYLVEKCLEQGNPFRTYIAEELLKSNRLVALVQNEYGNYVIQKLLKSTKVHDNVLYQRFCKKLQPALASFECSLFGRNVANLLKDQCKEDEASEGRVQKWQKVAARHREAAFEEKRQYKERCC